MRVAVVGAGLAGLSVAWHLCSRKDEGTRLEVSLFDAKGIGGGSSGVSTGLMHPFAGRRALRSWKSAEGMEASKHLIQVAEQSLGRAVCEKSGVFRPAITPQQKTDFLLRAEEDDDANWKEDPIFGCGLWILKGITFYSKSYLEGLWKACHAKGVPLVQRAILSLDELAEFDAIVVSAGFESLRFAPHCSLEVTKGQTLLCRWPQKLPFSLVSVGHITPTEDPSICQIGSTYEHCFDNLDPDPKEASRLIENVAKFYPPVRDFQILEIRAGARISRPRGYRPLIEKINPKTWVFTALGSRGFLYHGLFGELLAQEIVNHFKIIR